MAARPWGELLGFGFVALFMGTCTVLLAVLTMREARVASRFGERETIGPAEATLDEAHPARLVRLVGGHWRCDAAVSPPDNPRHQGITNRIWVPIEEREGDMSSTRLFVLDIGTRECIPREVDGVLARDQGGFDATIPAHMGAYNGWDLPMLVVGAGPPAVTRRLPWAIILGSDAVFVAFAWWRFRRRP